MRALAQAPIQYSSTPILLGPSDSLLACYSRASILPSPASRRFSTLARARCAGFRVHLAPPLPHPQRLSSQTDSLFLIPFLSPPLSANSCVYVMLPINDWSHINNNLGVPSHTVESQEASVGWIVQASGFGEGGPDLW